MSIFSSAQLRPDDLVIPQGSDWGIEWPLFDADGEPLNTVGYSGRGQIRAKYATPVEGGESDGSGVLAELAVAVTGGKVSVTVGAEESAAWTFRGGIYDVEVVSGDGRVTRVAQGRVRVDREVTR